MKPYNQREDAETVRPRKINVPLSDYTAERIAEKAARCGMTTGNLLSNYANDLVSGAQSNGSDERDLASEYYDRCGLEWTHTNSFLTSLLDSGYIKEIADDYETILYYENDPRYKTDPEIKADVDFARREIQLYYQTYKETYKNNPDSLEKGLADLKRYLNDMGAIIKDADPFIAYLHSVYGTLCEENEKNPGAADEKIKLLKAIRDAYKQIRKG